MNNKFIFFIISLVLCGQALRAMDSAGAASSSSVESSDLGCCGICLNEMTNKQDLVAAFECGHVSHRECILDNGRVRCACCPICRAKALGEFQPAPVPAHAPAPAPVQDRFSVLVRPDDVPQAVWERVIGFLRATDGQTLNLSGTYLTLQQLASMINALPQAIRLQISILDMNNNQLATLPREIGNLTQLKELYANGNLLTALPEEIGILTQLEKLDVSGNQLAMLPEAIGNLTQLDALLVNSNKLTVLPGTIGNLTRLRKLWLGGNLLTALPRTIGNLTRLEILDAPSNRLIALPETIGNLTQLQVLSVSSNWLTVLPISIQRLKHLESLCVDRLLHLPKLRSEVNIKKF